ncbi:transglutaminase-like domain-containing protein [Megasphaera paucivorans]|uniref:Transglutaminase-like superfamily protein n=1 Tax=Megasphaera paucivorans TaxID=349095 RepID=A0A1G9YML2_9FIRM|nr:transglutaminase-like domain-containing protein [Megasphaera paucivorans]SDN10418.1 Transglutaminase-like superfamily protein [Megasphaera paucivorans]
MKYINLYGNTIGRVLVLNLGVLAVLSCMLSYSTCTIYAGEIAFSLSVCTFLYVLSCSGSVTRLLGYSITAGIAFCFIYKYSDMFYPSLLYMANSFIEVLKRPYHLQLLTLPLPHTSYAVNQEPMLLLLIFILAAVFHVLIKNRAGCLIILLITIPGCFFGLYFNVLPNSHSLMSMAAFWLAVLIFLDKQFEKKAGFRAILAIAILFFSAGILQCVIPKANYVHPQFMKYIPQSLQNFLDTWLSPGGRATSLDDIRHGIQGHGHLGDMDTLTQTGRSIMHVQTSLHVDSCLYLRNYSGAVYNDNSWNDLPDTVYRQYNRLFNAYSPGAWYDQSVIMFESLDQDIRGQKELMSYLESGMSYSDMFSSRLFKIDHLFREQNQYFFPYNLDISSSGFKYDKAAKEEGLKVYQATAYDMPPRFDTIHSFIQEYGQYNKNISSYGYIENMYRNFVYTYYLQVPKGILGRFSKDFPIIQVQTEEERQQFITDLQQYFQNHYTYTRSPGRVPKGKDFVSYFLNESHAGYCTYFASAATLILRQAGIPARYVVGYAIPKQAVEAGSVMASDDGQPIHAFTVTDKQAHAWVEIYEDGWGWRPVDFTPGFMPKSTAGTGVQNHRKLQNNTNPDHTAQNHTDNRDKKSIPPVDTNKSPAEHKVFAVPQSHSSYLAFIAGILSIGGGAFLWRKYCSQRRQRLFAGDITAENQKDRMARLYAYMEKLAAYCGKERPEEMDYLCYAEYLQQNERCWNEVAIKTFIMIALKARFDTPETLREEEIMTALCIIQQMRQCLYHVLARRQRLIFTYFYRL